MNNRPPRDPPSLPRQYPTLEGVAVPNPLKTAIRHAYQHIYDLRDDVLKRISDLSQSGGCNCLIWKGVVATVGDLPTTGNEVGDGWIVESTGHLWVWDGTAWVDAGPIMGPPGPAGPAGPPGPPGGGGSGTVTNTGGALTVDLPMFGAGGVDSKVGTKTGNTDKVVTNTGTNVTGNTVKWDASGNLIDAGSTPGSSSPLTTKGDLFGHSTIDARVPVGTDGQLLVADSTQTLGIKWSNSALVIATGPNVQSDLTASKALATVYHNTGTKPLYVSVSGYSTAANGLIAYTDSSNPPTTVVAIPQSSDLSLNLRTVFFIVLPGNYYKVEVSAGTGTLYKWIEWVDGSTNTALTLSKGDLVTYDTGVTRLPVGSDGQVLVADSAQAKGIKWAAGGTVTSVALTVPAEFSVSGSPITTSGTLAVSKATQSANTVYAGPTTGSAAAPTFRAVVPADLPLASSSAFGAVKVDGTTITASSGVISAAGGSAGALILLEQHTASSSAALNFTSCITSTYDEYVVEYLNVLPATDNVVLRIQVSTNGGSTYDTGNNYKYSVWAVNSAGGTGANASAAAAGAYLADNISNVSANGGVSGRCTLYAPGGTTHLKMTLESAWYVSGPGNWLYAGGTAVYVSTTAVNAFRVIASSGNIASGIVRVYGIAK